jgi:hypothetical protein
MTTPPPPGGDGLPVAFRVWTEHPSARDRRRSTAAARRRRRKDDPEHVLIIDTETRVDVGQGLLYGGYWFCATTPDGRLRCLEEGLFHADNLPKKKDQPPRVRDPAPLHRRPPGPG